jgi:hypothetical protein
MNQINIKYQEKIGGKDKYKYHLSSIMHEDLSIFYLLYHGEFPLIPGLYSYCMEEALANRIEAQGAYLLPVFYGENQEKYYVLCNDGKENISRVYRQSLGGKIEDYAECFTSWIMSIAQCYQDDVYSIIVDEVSGDNILECDLHKMELIFEKFNPYQITAWKKIHNL